MAFAVLGSSSTYPDSAAFAESVRSSTLHALSSQTSAIFDASASSALLNLNVRRSRSVMTSAPGNPAAIKRHL
jgi:hypothetical protein